MEDAGFADYPGRRTGESMSTPAALSDLDIYRELTLAADALDRLAAQAATFVGEAAAQTAASSVRGMAKAVYEHSLQEDAGDVH